MGQPGEVVERGGRGRGTGTEPRQHLGQHLPVQGTGLDATTGVLVGDGQGVEHSGGLAGSAQDVHDNRQCPQQIPFGLLEATLQSGPGYPTG